MFDNILVPLDRSRLAECVLPHAVAMARAFQSQITLLSVLDQGVQMDCAVGVDPLDPLDWCIRKAETEAYLHSIANRLQETGLAVKTHLLEGEASEQIVDFAHNSAVNLVILSSHGRSGLTGWNLGSVAHSIVMQVRTSIMVVRAYQCGSPDLDDQCYQQLLVPIDGSQRAEEIWPLATTLAGAQGAQILLAQVVKRPEMPCRLPLSREDTELLDRIVKRNQEEAERCVDELRSWMPASVRGRVLVSDQVPATLHQLAEEEAVDLVVLSAHGYSGRTRFLHGSVAINFIIYGSTPVLIVQNVPAAGIQPNAAETHATNLRDLSVSHSTYRFHESRRSLITGSPVRA